MINITQGSLPNHEHGIYILYCTITCQLTVLLFPAFYLAKVNGIIKQVTIREKLKICICEKIYETTKDYHSWFCGINSYCLTKTSRLELDKTIIKTVCKSREMRVMYSPTSGYI